MYISEVTVAKSTSSLDSRAFRNALGSFPTGVAIITTEGIDGEPVGLTCNSFSSVSLDPPLVSWSLRMSSKSLQAFRYAKTFAINVLGKDQKNLSAHFANSSIFKKFEGVAHSRGTNGIPLIDDCVAIFQCTKFAEHNAGDHVLFLGQVTDFDYEENEDSLVFYKSDYRLLSALPSSKK